MMPGLDPRSLKKMMKQMGMNMEEIPSSEVIIKKQDGGEIKITNPQVTKMKVPGQGESFQVIGDISEGAQGLGGSGAQISEEDINMVAEQAKVSREEAKEALEANKGDIAKAILQLKT